MARSEKQLSMKDGRKGMKMKHRLEDKLCKRRFLE